MIRALAIAAALVASTAMAETPLSDGIAAEGLLSDRDFFRLVTCGAPPGGACRGSALVWDKPVLTIAIVPGSDPVPAGFAARLAAAVDHAIPQINATGAGIRLSRTDQPDPDIRIMPTALAEGTVMTEVPGFSAPGTMGVGYMTIWSDDADKITAAVILISTTITDEDLTSVMLEEVTQSLGPLYDIENPAYEGVSILSQTSNATTTIAGQDAALLRWLYPPR